MEIELMGLVLARLGGGYLILELVILALNPIPDTPEKWKTKKRNLFRRLCCFLALSLALVWLWTL